MKKVYKFTEHNQVVFKTNILNKEFKNNWLTITLTGDIIIEPEYSWDGCSPKFNLLQFACGTPDGMLLDNGKPITYYASLLHDALYQFKKDIPLSRKEVDKLFFKSLKTNNFYWSKVYYIAVRLFGSLYGKWKNK